MHCEGGESFDMKGRDKYEKVRAGASIKHEPTEIVKGDGTPVSRTEAGVKFDSEKLRWDLLPFLALEDIVKVLDYGAKKYGPHNWQLVENWKPRYVSELLRHIAAYMIGEHDDKDSGLSHLAHAACNLLFLIMKEAKDKPT